MFKASMAISWIAVEKDTNAANKNNEIAKYINNIF